MKATQLIGMPVISVAEGVKAGHITDITILSISPQVDALVLKSDREQHMLSFEAIRTIGPDAVMIDELRWMRGERESDSDDNTRRFSAIVGKETAGDDGTYLGDLKDLEIDRESGRIESIMLHRGGVMGIGGEDVIVPGDHLHAFGSRLLTVAPPAALSDEPSLAPPVTENRSEIDDDHDDRPTLNSNPRLSELELDRAVRE